MNWKLIFQLSLFGLAMGVATVFLIPSTVEPLFWLVVFAISAYAIAQSPRANPSSTARSWASPTASG